MDRGIDDEYGSAGGGPEQRVSALERGYQLIIGKLDWIADDIRDQRFEIRALRMESEKRFGAIEGRFTGIGTSLDAKAARSDLTPIEAKLGTTDGIVKGLPGTPALITLVVSTVALCLGGAAGLAVAFPRFLKP